jgi:transposase
LSTKIHFVVDAYGYPVYFILSEGQKSGSTYAIPVLSHVDIEGSDVLGDKGYDADKIIDFVYGGGGEPTIPSKANRTFQRKCDWWLYKERHHAGCFFQKLKNYRRIATRYDKLSRTFAGFICLACICIWMDCTVAKSIAA